MELKFIDSCDQCQFSILDSRPKLSFLGLLFIDIILFVITNAMYAAKEIASDHKDLIHDVAFDFHGRRMATCSSDQTVKV